MINIIRTVTVELTTIPAIAYKQKLMAGGAGLKIFRLDKDAEGVFSLDKRGGVPVPYGPIDKALFPDEALDEAIELTIGLPYAKRGKIKVSASDYPAKESIDVVEDNSETPNMVDSDEYKAIVERYSDEKGKINYTLMNKDFIQFTSRSKVVSEMVDRKALEQEILTFVVKSRATELSGKKTSLTDKETDALIETLNEIDPRGAFKELTAYIRRMLAKG